MYKNKEYNMLKKLIFNEFKYISFILSLITIFLLLIFFVKRNNTLTVTSDFLNRQFDLKKYSDTGDSKIQDKYIIINLESLVKAEKLENMAIFLSSTSDLVLNINKELNLNKINLELKKKNIHYDLDKNNITFNFIQSYSFFNYQQISDNQLSEVVSLIHDEIEKKIKEKKLSIRPLVYIKNLNSDIAIYYKIISSIFLLTFFFNFCYALIKYKKYFF